jgi:hypothetical protein
MVLKNVNRWGAQRINSHDDIYDNYSEAGLAFNLKLIKFSFQRVLSLLSRCYNVTT